MLLVNAATTLDAMVRLTLALHLSVEADEIAAAILTVLRITSIQGQSALNLHLVVMSEDGGDIDAVGTGHAVLAGISDAQSWCRAFPVLL